MKFVSIYCPPFCPWIHYHRTFSSPFHRHFSCQSYQWLPKSRSSGCFSVLPPAFDTDEVSFLLEPHLASSSQLSLGSPFTSLIIPHFLYHWRLRCSRTQDLTLFSSLPTLALKWASVQPLALNAVCAQMTPKHISPGQLFFWTPASCMQAPPSPLGCIVNISNLTWPKFYSWFHTPASKFFFYQAFPSQ